MTDTVINSFYNLDTFDIRPILDTPADMTDREVMENFNHMNLKLLSDPEKRDKYNVCFNYALKMNDDDLYCCSDTMEILDEEYFCIDIEDVKYGDIVSFHEGEPSLYNSNHFAIVEKPSNKIEDILIKSKWGTWGIFLSDFEALPDVYGEHIVFWRQK